MNKFCLTRNQYIAFLFVFAKHEMRLTLKTTKMTNFPVIFLVSKEYAIIKIWLSDSEV